MNTPDEPALRELFRATHRTDEDHAPDFEGLWASADTRYRQHRVRMRVARWTTMAALLVVATLLAVRRSSPPQDTTAMALPWRSVVLFSEWQAPTDSLLSWAGPTPFSYKPQP
jgi:hypothetical protein